MNRAPAYYSAKHGTAFPPHSAKRGDSGVNQVMEPLQSWVLCGLRLKVKKLYPQPQPLVDVNYKLLGANLFEFFEFYRV